MVNVEIITNSELDSFRSCPRLWAFRYAERLRPRAVPRALTMGRCVHAGMAAGYRAWQQGPEATVQAAERGVAEALGRYLHEELERQRGELTAEQLDQMAREAEETARVGKWMVGHFFRAMESEDRDDLIPLLIEEPFEVPVPDGVGRPTFLHLAGVFDLVSYSKRYGDIVLDEHKTTRGQTAEISRRVEMDPQTTGYVCALRYWAAQPLSPLRQAVDRWNAWHHDQWIELRKLVPGRVRYNVLRKKVPAEPTINKDGRVSAAQIDTLPEIYEAALETQRQRGIPVTEPQQARLEALRARGDAFVRRHEYHRTEEEIERWRVEVRVDARRIRSARRDRALWTRNIGHCAMPWSMPCQYRSLCLDPGAREVREREYYVADEVHAELRRPQHDRPGTATVEEQEEQYF